MTKKNNPFRTIRENGNEIQNHVIDEFLSGRLSRRELLRAGGVLGLWTLGGAGFFASNASRAADQATGTIRIGHPMPSGAIDPLTAFDVASPALLNQSGE